MKKLNTKSKLVALAAMIVIGIAAIWAFNSGVSARSMLGGCRTCGAVFSFGMLGITSEQTARLSVVNTETCVLAHPCLPAQVALRFVKGDGTPVTNADGYPIGSSTVTLAPGQSAFLDMSCPGGCSGPARVQFRAEVPSCIGCGDGKGTVLATLEVFDNATGKTTFVMPDHPAISSRVDDDNK